jgi:hypothetical protein
MSIVDTMAPIAIVRGYDASPDRRSASIKMYVKSTAYALRNPHFSCECNVINRPSNPSEESSGGGFVWVGVILSVRDSWIDHLAHWNRMDAARNLKALDAFYCSDRAVDMADSRYRALRSPAALRNYECRSQQVEGD